jgi:hypothetical protein
MCTASSAASHDAIDLVLGLVGGVEIEVLVLLGEQRAELIELHAEQASHGRDRGVALEQHDHGGVVGQRLHHHARGPEVDEQLLERNADRGRGDGHAAHRLGHIVGGERRQAAALARGQRTFGGGDERSLDALDRAELFEQIEQLIACVHHSIPIT